MLSTSVLGGCHCCSGSCKRLLLTSCKRLLLTSCKRLLLTSCLASQQPASVSQGCVCLDSCMCCHTEAEVTHRTCCLSHSQYTDTRPTSRSADPVTPDAWQCSRRSTHFEVTGMTRKKPERESGVGSQVCRP